MPFSSTTTPQTSKGASPANTQKQGPRGRTQGIEPMTVEQVWEQLVASNLAVIDPRSGRYELTDTASSPTTAATVAQWVARLPEQDQEDFLLNSVPPGTPANTVREAIAEERAQEFRNGNLLPGVDATGGGTNLTTEERAAIVQGQNIERGTEILDSISEDPDQHYTYTPEMDQGAGYSLQDGQQFFDESVDPLVLAQEEALRQTRSDTTGVDAQGRSLQDYDEAINTGGLTAIDRARIEQMRQDTARRARSQEGAIQAEMAERGRGGGVASMLLRSQAQQAAANQRGLYDMQVGALGLERKDRLIGERADLGGSMQDATDSIDRFNTENSQAVVMRNADRENIGRSTTWQQNQSNANANIAQGNQYNTQQWAEDSGRATRNTNTANQAAAFNVGPNQGERGRLRDTLGASQAISGDANAAAGILGQQFTPPGSGDDGSTTAAQIAAIGGAITPVVSAINPAVGAGVGGASGAIGVAGKKDDEDE